MQKMKTTEFLGKATEENLCDLEDRQRFHRTRKPLTIKKIIDYTLLKLISSVFWRKKRQTTVEIKINIKKNNKSTKMK